jgi:hypothetical protein
LRVLRTGRATSSENSSTVAVLSEVGGDGLAQRESRGVEEVVDVVRWTFAWWATVEGVAHRKNNEFGELVDSCRPLRGRRRRVGVAEKT